MRQQMDYLICVVMGCAVKSFTSLLNRMSRLRAQPSDRLVASDSLWFASYLLLLVIELANCAATSIKFNRIDKAKAAAKHNKRMRLTRIEIAQCVLVALVYTLMENLQFYVLEQVQSPVFQTVGNLKVLGAAFFSWCILGTKFKRHQYVAMVLLVAGSMATRCSVRAES